MSGIEKKVAERYVRWGILCVRLLGPQAPEWETWADNWLSGEDRSPAAAIKAEEATFMAGSAPCACVARAAAPVVIGDWKTAILGTIGTIEWVNEAVAMVAILALLATTVRIVELARECGLPLTCDHWRQQGLMPESSDGRVLVWKHVTRDGKGNLGFQYRVGEEFMCVSHVCAGPFGALRWCKGGHPYIMAIEGECYDLDPERGVYLCLTGVPVALYRAENMTEDGFVPVLLVASAQWRLAAQEGFCFASGCPRTGERLESEEMVRGKACLGLIGWSSRSARADGIECRWCDPPVAPAFCGVQPPGADQGENPTPGDSE